MRRRPATWAGGRVAERPEPAPYSTFRWNDDLSCQRPRGNGGSSGRVRQVCADAPGLCTDPVRPRRLDAPYRMIWSLTAGPGLCALQDQLHGRVGAGRVGFDAVGLAGTVGGQQAGEPVTVLRELLQAVADGAELVEPPV